LLAPAINADAQIRRIFGKVTDAKGEPVAKFLNQAGNSTYLLRFDGKKWNVFARGFRTIAGLTSPISAFLIN
jgi:hypothetical protein